MILYSCLANRSVVLVVYHNIGLIVMMLAAYMSVHCTFLNGKKLFWIFALQQYNSQKVKSTHRRLVFLLRQTAHDSISICIVVCSREMRKLFCCLD